MNMENAHYPDVSPLLDRFMALAIERVPKELFSGLTKEDVNIWLCDPKPYLFPEFTTGLREWLFDNSEDDEHED